MHDPIGANQVDLVEGFDIDCLHSIAHTMSNFDYFVLLEYGRSLTLILELCLIVFINWVICFSCYQLTQNYFMFWFVFNPIRIDVLSKMIFDSISILSSIISEV